MGKSYKCQWVKLSKNWESFMLENDNMVIKEGQKLFAVPSRMVNGYLEIAVDIWTKRKFIIRNANKKYGNILGSSYEFTICDSKYIIAPKGINRFSCVTFNSVKAALNHFLKGNIPQIIG